ncbi:exodeoxyribonuclease III [Ignavibacteria bacterium]|jgi:exodeoxyribonuclease-3|nr:exodeoxyribonuclease III [Bacteroidota bacterium]MCZ2133488.1 exodeoxyribonuclease III [Bacteroidota bacterium]
MKIISWNINGIRAAYKKGLGEYIERENPDILCLQETKAEPEQLTPEQRTPDCYSSFFHSCAIRKGYSGVATFTKRKPDNVRLGFGIDRFDEEGRVVQCDFGAFTLLNIYFPNGGRGDERVRYKIDFYDALFDYCNTLRQHGKRLLICGDYNTAHYEIDLARPKENEKTSGFLPEERKKLDEMAQNGYIDAFRMFNSEGGHYTWWDQKTRARERNIGWRIDYHWITDDIVPLVKNCYHQPEITGSDHCPVIIELDADISNFVR